MPQWYFNFLVCKEKITKSHLDSWIYFFFLLSALRVLLPFIFKRIHFQAVWMLFLLFLLFFHGPPCTQSAVLPLWSGQRGRPAVIRPHQPWRMARCILFTLKGFWLKGGPGSPLSVELLRDHRRGSHPPDNTQNMGNKTQKKIPQELSLELLLVETFKIKAPIFTLYAFLFKKYEVDSSGWTDVN